MRRIGIIAALPGELKPLVQGFEPMRLPGARKGEAAWRGSIGESEGVAICAGMGKEAAERACVLAAQDGVLDALVSYGWAGALSCGVRPGNAYAVNEVVEARTGEKFSSDFLALGGNAVPLKLVTIDHVAQPAEKRRLAESYRAVLVDMEAATVARLARAQGIAFYCLKAVSDAARDVLPDFSRYTGSQGQLRIAAMLAHVAIRPKYWPGMVRVGKNSRSGAVAIAGALGPLITHG